MGFFSVFFFIYWSTVVDRILHYQTLPNTERFHCIPVALFNFATVHSLDYKEYLKVFFVAVSNPLNFSLRKYERFLCKNKLLSTVWVCVYISILTYIHTYIHTVLVWTYWLGFLTLYLCHHSLTILNSILHLDTGYIIPCKTDNSLHSSNNLFNLLWRKKKKNYTLHSKGQCMNHLVS